MTQVSRYDYNRLVTGFTKLFSTLVDSTVWREPNHIRLVWITMLAKADRNGRVLASLPGLADAARVSVEECQEAIEHLSAPDKWSRTKTNEGRRVEEIDGGWRLLNYLKYRELRDETERRIQVREAVRRHREKKSDHVTVSHSKPQKAQAEAEAEADNGQQKKSADADARAVFEYWKEKTETAPRSERLIDATLKRIRARMRDGCSVEDLKRAVDVAVWDEFYRERAYHKQPEVIWKSAERVQSLLAKWEREAARPIPL